MVLPEDGLYGSTFTRETLTPFLEALPATGTTDNVSFKHRSFCYRSCKPCLQTYVPCDDSNAEKETPVFHQLSCIAKKYKVDLIANMGDIEPCGCLEETCPPNGHYQYNTNVALWRNGSVRYSYLFPLVNPYHVGHSMLASTISIISSTKINSTVERKTLCSYLSPPLVSEWVSILVA